MKTLERALGQKIISSAPVSGGCISNSQKIETSSGVFFCKLSKAPTSMFREEAAGLEALAELGEIRVPRVQYFDKHHLVLEWIETKEPNKEFFEDFGRRLARLHRPPQPEFGFKTNNHIGTTPQTNPRRSYQEISWAEYFIEYRLRPMLISQSLSVASLLQINYQRAHHRIREILGTVTEPPSLVHGDLWGGNFICDSENQAVLIDPAPYRGHREVDLAMSELFGGFAPEFYRSYEAEFPKQPGYEDRKKVYNLYHLMNHWIIFGAASYREKTMALLQSI